MGTFFDTHVQEAVHDITGLGGFITSTLLLLLLLAGHKVDLFFSTLLGIGVVYALGVGIRIIYFKPRPHQEPTGTWFERIYASSFPSIHSMRIAMYAMIFSVYVHVIWFTVMMTGIALTVGYSRVYLKKHDWIDVCVGLALGGLIGWFV